jgi:hypothetical protein
MHASARLRWCILWHKWLPGAPQLRRTVSELADSTATSSTDPWLGDVTVELTNRLSQAVCAAFLYYGINVFCELGPHLLTSASGSKLEFSPVASDARANTGAHILGIFLRNILLGSLYTQSSTFIRSRRGSTSTRRRGGRAATRTPRAVLGLINKNKDTQTTPQCPPARG